MENLNEIVADEFKADSDKTQSLTSSEFVGTVQDFKDSVRELKKTVQDLSSCIKFNRSDSIVDPQEPIKYSAEVTPPKPPEPKKPFEMIIE